MKYFLRVIVSSLFLIPAVVSAVTSNDFIFRISVGDDAIPPSTPTLLSVTPIAPTQIDVDWSVSTDNWIFGGYVLLRDGTPIATTTLTSYSDTGLAPETLYTYEVYAFDAAGNISTTSNSLATTTPAIPVPPPAPIVPTSTNQVTQTLRLGDFTLTPGQTEVVLNWGTNIPTRYLVRWGRTDSYTGGYISNESYAASHITSITDLEPGTRYEYEIIGYSPANIAISLKRGSFTTVGEETTRVVSNVERLTATVLGTDVRLDFSLPENEPGARVWVVRSYLGFPADLYDGAVVYEGSADSVYDTGALIEKGIQYYTVFVIAVDGSISSGAVVRVARVREGDFEYPPITTPVVPGYTETATNTEEELSDLPIDLLQVNDIVVTQGEKRFTFLSDAIELSHTLSFTLSIPKEALPRHLKSIIVTLLDPTDQRRSYSFLLRLNQAGTAYEATVAPLNVLGTSKLRVEVYDFDQLVIGRYAKQVVFNNLDTSEPVVIFPDLFLEAFSRAWWGILVILGVLSGIFFIFWLLRRRAEDKE